MTNMAIRGAFQNVANLLMLIAVTHSYCTTHYPLPLVAYSLTRRIQAIANIVMGTINIIKCSHGSCELNSRFALSSFWSVWCVNSRLKIEMP